MKSIIKNIAGFICIIIGLSSCENINDVHEEYLKWGEEIYTGVVDSLEAYPGNERIKFTWMINADPRITKTVIYWNDGGDSAVVEVNRTQSGIMRMETSLNLPENSYIFKFVTKDDEGHKSLNVEKTADIYGSRYVSTLRNREIRTIVAQEDNSVKLTWSSIESETLLYTMITYTDNTEPSNPKTIEKKVENDMSETVLSNLKAGDEFTVVSVYQPLGSLDTFEASATVYHVPIAE